MKKIYFLITIALAFVLLAASSGPGEIQNRERTGTPDGDNVCSQCHSSGAFSPNMTFAMFDPQGNEVTSYVPGTIYELMWQVNETEDTPSGYGFQSTVLDTGLNNSGEFATLDTETQIETVDNTNVTNRIVIEHSTPSSSGEWTALWTAPEAGTGDVTFYYSGVAANLNGMTSGDGYGGDTSLITEDEADNVSEVSELSLDYTMFDGELNLFSDQVENLQSIEIYSITGKKVYTNNVLSLPLTIPSFDLAKGVNIINAFDGVKQYQFKVIN